MQCCFINYISAKMQIESNLKAVEPYFNKIFVTLYNFRMHRCLCGEKKIEPFAALFLDLCIFYPGTEFNPNSLIQALKLTYA